MSFKWMRQGEVNKYRPNYVSTADVTVGNTLVETTLLGAGNGSLTVPGGVRKVGDRNILSAEGIISSTGNPTLRIQLKRGTVILADTGVQTMGNQVDGHWILSAQSVLRSTGVAGELAIAGSFMTQLDHFQFSNPIPVIIDTTAPAVIDITVIWGTAVAGNTIMSQILSFNSILSP